MVGGEVGHRCRELLREITISKELLIYAGSIKWDYIHMLIENTAAAIHLPSSTIPEGEEFAQIVVSVQG
jgi:hypothetical protein